MDFKKEITRRQLVKYGLYGGLSAGILGDIFLAGCRSRFHKNKRPNIIFILIDALRADRLGCYGNLENHTPVMDSIAAESVIFNRVVAQSSWTQPSIASLFCSYYPSVHKVRKWRKIPKEKRAKAKKVAVLNDNFITLAESLQKSGYDTAAFVANPWIVPELGFAQGFEHFDSSFANNTTPGDMVNKAAVTWLRNRNSDKPFFCYLHYMDVHGPYNSRPEILEPLLNRVDSQADKYELSEKQIAKLGYLYELPGDDKRIERHKRLSVYREYWEARYNAGVREIDLYIKDLRVQLEAMNLWDDSYTIITSDHGESLLEHGYWDHGLSLHDTELHVPLLLRWPGTLSEGMMINKTVRLIDLMPTIVEQLGTQEVVGLQGRSLMGEIKGKNVKSEVAAFAECTKSKDLKAAYLDGWKLIMPWGNQSVSHVELYNIEEDPLEQNELSKMYPNRVKMLAEILEKQSIINEKLGSEIWVDEVSLTDEQEKRLRSLGYVR